MAKRKPAPVVEDDDIPAPAAAAAKTPRPLRVTEIAPLDTWSVRFTLSDKTTRVCTTGNSQARDAFVSAKAIKTVTPKHGRNLVVQHTNGVIELALAERGDRDSLIAAPAQRRMIARRCACPAEQCLRFPGQRTCHRRPGVIHIAGAYDPLTHTQVCANCGALVSTHQSLTPLAPGTLVEHFDTHTKLADRRDFSAPTCAPMEHP